MRCQNLRPFPIGWGLRAEGWGNSCMGGLDASVTLKIYPLSKLLIQRLKRWWSSTSETSFSGNACLCGSLQLLYRLSITQSSQHAYGVGSWISTVGWKKNGGSEKLGQLPKIKQLVRAWCQAPGFSFLYNLNNLPGLKCPCVQVRKA